MDQTKAHEREAQQLLVQTQINELQTHRARQEALQLLVQTQVHEHEAKRLVQIARTCNCEEPPRSRPKPNA